ncbi:MAG: hypothetical protein K9K67_14385 [Bacteriovoracaceae bacterium]|nr:hypothetical protein [Bacteriovoracaceae bacterium]
MLENELFTSKEEIKRLEETYNQNKINNFTLKPIQDVAKKAIQSIEENDPAALKVVYRLLFEQIIVSDLNNEGVREVNFVLRDFRSTEDGNLIRTSKEMVPGSGRISKRSSRANCLNLLNSIS